MSEAEYTDFLNALVADLSRSSIAEVQTIDSLPALSKAATLAGIYRMLDLRSSVTGEVASFLPLGKTLPHILAEKAQQSWLDYKLSSRDFSNDLKEDNKTLDNLKKSIGVPSKTENPDSVTALAQQQKARLDDLVSKVQAPSAGLSGWKVSSPYGFPVAASVDEDWESSEDIDFDSQDDSLNPLNAISQNTEEEAEQEKEGMAAILQQLSRARAAAANSTDTSEDSEEEDEEFTIKPATEYRKAGEDSEEDSSGDSEEEEFTIKPATEYRKAGEDSEEEDEEEEFTTTVTSHTGEDLQKQETNQNPPTNEAPQPNSAAEVPDVGVSGEKTPVNGSLPLERATPPRKTMEAEDILVAGVTSVYSLIARKGKK